MARIFAAPHGMPDEVLARAAALALVGPFCEGEGAAQQVAVDVRLVRRDVRDQLLDEVLVPFLCLDDGHVPSVDGGPNEGSWPNGAFPKGMARELHERETHAQRLRMRARARAIRRLDPHARRARLARRFARLDVFEPADARRRGARSRALRDIAPVISARNVADS